jgi:hypothetical protein
MKEDDEAIRLHTLLTAGMHHDDRILSEKRRQRVCCGRFLGSSASAQAALVRGGAGGQGKATAAVVLGHTGAQEVQSAAALWWQRHWKVRRGTGQGREVVEKCRATVFKGQGAHGLGGRRRHGNRRPWWRQCCRGAGGGKAGRRGSALGLEAQRGCRGCAAHGWRTCVGAGSASRRDASLGLGVGFIGAGLLCRAKRPRQQADGDVL